MAADRPKIPADIERRVLVESGHRCAVPRCRHIEVEIHHIEPWDKCQKHEYENLIALCPNCHSRADRWETSQDRLGIDRKSLRIYKSKLRNVHDKYSQFEVDFLFNLYNNYKSQQSNQSVVPVMFPPFLMLLIKRLLDSKFIFKVEQKGGVYIGGMKSDPDHYYISEKGVEFIDSLEG